MAYDEAGYKRRLREAAEGEQRAKARSAAQSESSFYTFLKWLFGNVLWEGAKALFGWFRGLFGF